MDGKREIGRPRRRLECGAQDVFDMSLWLAKNLNELAGFTRILVLLCSSDWQP